MEDHGVLISMRIRYTILAITLLFLTSGCYATISGTVVDAETGEPIEGAVVLVEWTKTKGLGLTYTESYKVIEAITDKEGKVTISGTLSPLVDPPSVTVYKRGYVAWNDKFIFPGYKKREDFTWGNGYIFKMERFKEGYSYSEHVSFIRTAISSTLAYEKKKKIREAFNWETDLAREEIKRKK